MGVDWTEVRRGLRETRRFLFSHHTPDEFYRCHRVRVLGRGVVLCARCTGVYPGILLGVAVHLAGVGPLTAFWLVAVCPLPALLDWAMTTLRDYRGSNAVRTATGILLGFGYGSGLGHLYHGERWATLLVGAGYAVFAAAALAVQHARSV